MTMTTENASSLTTRLSQASQAACRQFAISPVTEERLADALFGAINPQKLIDNLAEVWRTSPRSTPPMPVSARRTPT